MIALVMLAAACAGSPDESVVQSGITNPRELAPAPAIEGSTTSTRPPQTDDGASSTTSTVTEQLLDLEAELRAQGEEIRADKRQNATKGGYEPFNAGDYAYPSRPVDITAPGEYATLVGPIDDWVSYDLSPDKPVPSNNVPAAWAIRQQSDQTFDAAPFEMHVVNEGGQRYLAVKFIVTEQGPGSFKPYPAFVFWLY